MLHLNGGNGYGNRRHYRACYQLLEGKVHSLRISYNFLKMGNCFRKLVCVCEPKRVIKVRKSRCCYSYFSFGDVKKRGIYWLDRSYAVDKLLQDGLDTRSLFIPFVVLKLVDGTSIAPSRLLFKEKEKPQFSFKRQKKKEERKKNLLCAK